MTSLLYQAQCPECSDTVAIYVRSPDGLELVCDDCAQAAADIAAGVAAYESGE